MIFRLTFFFISLFLFVGCTNTPDFKKYTSKDRVDTLIIGAKDKVHVYYTIDGIVSKNHFNTYLFAPNHSLFPIIKSFYDPGQSYIRPFSYWMYRNSVLLFSIYGDQGPVTTISKTKYTKQKNIFMTEASKGKYVSKPNEKNEVLHFDVIKNSFDVAYVHKKKKIKATTKNPKKIHSTDYSGKIKKKNRKSSLENSYYSKIKGAATGRVLATIAIGKYSNKSSAIKYIKKSCASSYPNPIPRKACINAAIYRLR